MPIYKCKVWLSSFEEIKVMARDAEDAKDKAQGQSGFRKDVVMDNLEVVDIDVELSDSQYSADKELEDQDERKTK